MLAISERASSGGVGEVGADVEESDGGEVDPVVGLGAQGIVDQAADQGIACLVALHGGAPGDAGDQRARQFRRAHPLEQLDQRAALVECGDGRIGHVVVADRGDHPAGFLAGHLPVVPAIGNQ
ncbi:hypothetical protein V1993_08425 [Pseudomonas aeruginosa]